MNRKLIKVCGMTDAANIRAVEALGADFVGFVFYPPSPRRAPDNPPDLPVGKPRVGVFVNAPAEEIIRRGKVYGLTFAQLHGDEDPAFCKNLRKKTRVIKAFGVGAELPCTAPLGRGLRLFPFRHKNLRPRRERPPFRLDHTGLLPG
ncbi:MAG: phosphoribosylanthranilate isomerase [Bacteroidales bacterium]|nr:phosphoribosylanthranilate isomerase [Bacteroidales bacterium]